MEGRTFKTDFLVLFLTVEVLSSVPYRLIKLSFLKQQVIHCSQIIMYTNDIFLPYF